MKLSYALLLTSFPLQRGREKMGLKKYILYAFIFLITLSSCCLFGSFYPRLELDEYTGAVRTITPNLDYHENPRNRSVCVNGALNTSFFADFKANTPDIDEPSLLCSWIGWDNDGTEGSNFITIGSEKAEPAGPDGWMVYRENTDGHYYETKNGDTLWDGKGEPGQKVYSILNSIFGNNGYSIFGTAQMTDRIINRIMDEIDADYNPIGKGTTVHSNISAITLPFWFGTVNDGGPGGLSSEIAVDFTAELNMGFFANYSQTNVAVRHTENDGEQVLVIYNKSDTKVELCYVRKDTTHSGNIDLYIKAFQLSFNGSAWEGCDFLILESNDNNGFYFKKGLKSYWDTGENDRYTFFVIGGGNINTSDYISLRLIEERWDSDVFNPDPDLDAMKSIILSNTNPGYPRPYYIIDYNTSRILNERFKPLYGEYRNLPEIPDNSNIEGNDYSAFDTYISLDYILPPADIPGTQSHSISYFSCWDENN
jgi:hypothetical protein